MVFVLHSKPLVEHKIEIHIHFYWDLPQPICQDLVITIFVPLDPNHLSRTNNSQSFPTTIMLQTFMFFSQGENICPVPCVLINWIQPSDVIHGIKSVQTLQRQPRFKSEGEFQTYHQLSGSRNLHLNLYINVSGYQLIDKSMV